MNVIFFVLSRQNDANGLDVYVLLTIFFGFIFFCCRFLCFSSSVLFNLGMRNIIGIQHDSSFSKVSHFNANTTTILDAAHTESEWTIE